jgi:hypothetical protein
VADIFLNFDSKFKARRIKCAQCVECQGGKKYMQNLAGKFEGKRSFGITRCSCEDNTKI